ncbi:TetR/AcrR family transcriptional regulator [Streptomyces iranensis]|uniref:AcrR family transcriptional regulator n=1 Tax=Streptomyces iranensis TaxID=576784 RepID=A0A060ZHC9_9ACTN|nr:TetR/AcrR family transcriptional regulator [Streptomyces iranensis]MBP2061275.1 AcrR family transcriptional regulator [Streptomyces iranensis]CDR05445.1 regulatory protein TetR [Streptomyces iranensis]
MPKVSQEYLDARRAEILTAARRCFVRDGFHETSMQDLLAEAGVSSGSIYRYFPSKQDMIIAIAEENLAEVVHEARRQAERRPAAGVGEAIADLLEVIRAKHAENGFAAIALLTWSESLRNPALAERLRTALTEATADLAAIVREHQDFGHLPPDAATDSLAQLITSTVPGYILQLATLGPDAVDGLPGAARALWPAPEAQ